MYVEGARWDTETMMLAESMPKVMCESADYTSVGWAPSKACMINDCYQAVMFSLDVARVTKVYGSTK